MTCEVVYKISTLCNFVRVLQVNYATLPLGVDEVFI